ncbi:glutathione S-transferase theta-3-like [Tubulanus polymorphus]|uniref:glutathione S-transferase theta-3-like n=1 Tax=Tubulanus polymorphus TaxID=672921 RepID=UPI003DA520BF
MANAVTKCRPNSTEETRTKEEESEQNEKETVTLYVVRIYPPCRAVWLYLLQHNIPHKIVDVDFSEKEGTTLEFINQYPHREVPLLVDGDIVVFEGQAILRYLACEYTNYNGYGPDKVTRYKCESLISWACSELHRIVGFRYTYPQFLDRYRLPSDAANEALVESGIRELSRLLEVLENRYLEKRKYLCCSELTVADSYVATILIQLKWTTFKFRMWPKVEEWLARVRMQDFWDEVHKAHKEFVKELETSAAFD